MSQVGDGMEFYMDKKNNIWVALIIILLGIALFVGGKVLLSSRKAGPKMYATVYSLEEAGKKLVRTMPLGDGRKQIYEFDGPLGITVVEVDGNRARVKSSPCPDQVCVQFGWLAKPHDFSACLPNATMVTIEDGQTYPY